MQQITKGEHGFTTFLGKQTVLIHKSVNLKKR